jgi:D,D-heptose 1,7-bisphosphate phosphatase
LLRQAVFLVGGLGTRLKHLTQTTPKPLLEVGGRPFLDYLIEEAARYGFTDILLLAGHLGEQMTARYEGGDWRGAKVRVLREPEPLGTGGALRFAVPQLAPQFLLANGDTFFDINLRALTQPGLLPPGGTVMALGDRVAGDRYGRTDFDGTHVRHFHAAGDTAQGPINAGIAVLDRGVLDRLPQGRSSLEALVYPELAREGLLRGLAFDSYFIDMGIPADLERARAELPARLRRPALFFDRDGVLNVEKGYLHKQSEFEWMPGAREAIRLANDKGWLVFVVTNQAGVARGFYEERDVHALHAFMQEELAAGGAHIDAFEYCPHHPDGVRAEYKKHCERRKPGAGMIRDLLKAWPVDAARSFLVGDMPHDIAAAETAGIRGHQFAAGNLQDFVAPLLG